MQTSSSCSKEGKRLLLTDSIDVVRNWKGNDFILLMARDCKLNPGVLDRYPEWYCVITTRLALAEIGLLITLSRILNRRLVVKETTLISKKYWFSLTREIVRKGITNPSFGTCIRTSQSTAERTTFIPKKESNN